VGWIPPGFAYDTTKIAGSHGTDANPGLCVTCHVAELEVTDAGGEFVLHSVGHLFEATPCLDDQGIPVAGGECTMEERDFSACATSGCHTTEAGAITAYQVVWNRMNNLIDQLWVDSNHDHALDPTDEGLLPMVAAIDPNELDASSSTVTVAKGAMWNAQLAYTADRTHWGGGDDPLGNHFSAHKASGNGVHNPFILEALLLASIEAVKDTYGVLASPGIDLSSQLIMPPGLRTIQ
jgi:hypothetical protein